MLEAPLAPRRPAPHPEASTGGRWLQLASGAPFAIAGPVTPLAIDDVAQSLAKICRFAGATTGFYSVAQHSVLVSRRAGELAGPEAALAGLLHDAHEMVLSDIPRPTKWALGTEVVSALKAVTSDIDQRIRVGLELAHPELALQPPSAAALDAVAQADDEALATEARDLMRPSTWPWGRLPPPWPGRIMAQGWSLAHVQFLSEWRVLTASGMPAGRTPA